MSYIGKNRKIALTDSYTRDQLDDRISNRSVYGDNIEDLNNIDPSLLQEGHAGIASGSVFKKIDSSWVAKSEVSVEAYGASPTASAEQNYEAIMQALEENAGKNIVRLDGMYPVSRTILTPSNTYLKGHGKRSGTGITMPDNIRRGEPVVITGHRLAKNENIILEGFEIDFNRNRWDVADASSEWQALTPSGAGVRHESNQNVTQSCLMVCASKNVIVRDVLATDGWKHCFDVSAPWYGRNANTPDPENPGEFISTAEQYDPDPAQYVWFENCEARGAGDDNFTSHQCSWVWITDCVSIDPSGIRQTNANCYEIDDASRNVWLVNYLGIGGFSGVQIKGHADSPAPYNVFLDNGLLINNAQPIDLRHTSWYGPGSDVDDLDEDDEDDDDELPPIASQGSNSLTANNVTIANTIVVAPRRFTPMRDGNERTRCRPVVIRSYKNVKVSNLIVTDGSDDIAKEVDGYDEASPTSNNRVVQINRGARNVVLSGVHITGFKELATQGVRITGSAGGGITTVGLTIIDSPRTGFYASGDPERPCYLDNYEIIGDHESDPDSTGVRMSSEVGSGIGIGSTSGFSSHRFGGTNFDRDIFALRKLAYFRDGAQVRCLTNTGFDLERTGTGRQLRLYRAGEHAFSLFATTATVWATTDPGRNVIIGTVDNEDESNDRSGFFRLSPSELEVRSTVEGVNLGSPETPWENIFSADGTISTSDARKKTDVRSMTSNELAAAKELAKEIGVYKWLHSIETKGSSAREHIGLTVQKVIDIMEKNELDPMRYGFVCYDSWEHKPAVYSEDEEGNPVLEEEEVEAGDAYSLRHNELIMFITRGFEERISALEKQLPK